MLSQVLRPMSRALILVVGMGCPGDFWRFCEEILSLSLVRVGGGGGERLVMRAKKARSGFKGGQGKEPR